MRKLIGIPLSGALGLAAGMAETIRFETGIETNLASLFSQHLTGVGAPGAWQLQRMDYAPSGQNVLVQTSRETNSYRFPHLVIEGFSATNAQLQVSFKTVSGVKDQAAGLVWRWQDSSNYYVARANALEGNVVMYKMLNGKRTDLKPLGAGANAYGAQAKVTPNTWHKLRVIALGNRFTVELDNVMQFEVQDSTFPGAGKVGLWTKADSVTAFDDFAVMKD